MGYPARSSPSSIPLESELADRFWERLRLFAVRRLRDAATAEDVAQETLRRVMEALRGDRIGNLAALPGFVFQTARHICQQHHRSAGREARALGQLSAPSDRDSDAVDPFCSLICQERCAPVRRALRHMSDEDRGLLRLLYFEQEETAAVAQRLGIAPGALRVRKHRALQRLGNLLEGSVR